MKVALIGATGFVGSEILKELLARGHEVVALNRDPAKIAPQSNLKTVQADAYEAQSVAHAVQGTDAVVSAFNPGWGKPDIHDLFLSGHEAIVTGVKASGVKRFIEVGGAGSLYVAPGVQLVDTPSFPAEWKDGALAAREALTRIQRETTLDWTFVSPAVFLEPGERSGKYRTSEDHVLMAGEAPARISTADLAVAIVDELESPKHIQKRFTAAN